MAELRTDLLPDFGANKQWESGMADKFTGADIRAVRKALMLNQTEFVELLGTDQRSISRAEARQGELDFKWIFILKTLRDERIVKLTANASKL